MYELKFENEDGKTITLSDVEKKYQIISITGLNPPQATLYQSEVSGMDGVKHMSAKLEKRNVVVTIRINGEVEKNRLNLYTYFKTKHYSKMYYSNNSRNVYIEGYVEAIECDLFSNSEQMQISIICPDPFFQSVQEIVTDISKVLGNFEFPFAFGALGVKDPTITDEAIEFSIYLKDRIVNLINEGEDETGFIIKITATDEVINPAIYNVDTREFFKMNITLAKTDVLTINTIKGQKSVTLLHDTVTTNAINKVDRESTWLSLSKGDNQFTYEADTGGSDMQIAFTHRTRYQAV